MKFLRLTQISLAIALSLNAASAFSGDLYAPKTVLNHNENDELYVEANYPEAVEGDMYLATQVGEKFYFFDADGNMHEENHAYRKGEVYEGKVPLFNLPVDGIPAGRYPLYQVTTETDGDVFDKNSWKGGLNQMNFNVGLPVSESRDYDNDGHADDDSNRDGYHDDDQNRDGYHDDDRDRDGYHDDDRDQDGFHDDDRDQDGFHDDDQDRDGFHDDDLNHDGYHDDDHNLDGYSDSEYSYSGQNDTYNDTNDGANGSMDDSASYNGTNDDVNGSMDDNGSYNDTNDGANDMDDSGTETHTETHLESVEGSEENHLENDSYNEYDD